MSRFEVLPYLVFGGVFFVFYASMCLTRLDGLADMFTRIRSWAGVRIVPYSTLDAVGNTRHLTKSEADSTLGKLLLCFYCTSFWVALPVGLIIAVFMGCDVVTGAAVTFFSAGAFAGAASWLLGVSKLS